MENSEKPRAIKVRFRRSPKPKLDQIEALSETELLTSIKELKRHIKMTEIIIRDFSSLPPVYTKKSHSEIINRYQLMNEVAIYELNDYVSALRKNYRPEEVISQFSHQ